MDSLLDMTKCVHQWWHVQVQVHSVKLTLLLVDQEWISIEIWLPEVYQPEPLLPRYRWGQLQIFIFCVMAWQKGGNKDGNFPSVLYPAIKYHKKAGRFLGIKIYTIHKRRPNVQFYQLKADCSCSLITSDMGTKAFISPKRQQKHLDPKSI